MNETETPPLVSIGIPCYNRPDGLKSALHHITEQTYQNLEIIVSDNCSSNTEVERIGKEFANKDKRVYYFRQKTNKGMAFNFEFVLKKARGEYFMWASDDDKWDSTFIEKCILEFNKSNRLVLVSSGCDCYNSKGEYSYSYDIFNTVGVKTFERCNIYLNNIYGFGLRLASLMHGLFLRDAIVKIKLVDIVNADFLFMTEIMLIGEVSCIDEVLIRKTRDRGKVHVSKSNISNFKPYLVLTIYLIKRVLLSDKLSSCKRLITTRNLIYLYFKYRWWK